MKVAVVTPYFRETEATLRRCLDSVRAQTHAEVTHYMVADGHARPDVLADYPGVVAIDLPRAHDDFGCTPRSVGALCALNSGADVVCFLDADNQVLPEHVASLVATYRRAEQAGQPLDAVFAHRHIFLPGHEHLRLKDEADMARQHVDTNCISLARSAAFMWPMWGLIPRQATPVCDRVFFDMLRAHGYRYDWSGRFTVRYESNWSFHYRLAGLPVPETGLHDEALRRLGAGTSPEELFAHLRFVARPRQRQG